MASTPHQRLAERCGTVSFLAPEVIKQDYAHECDVWGVGVMAYLLGIVYLFLGIAIVCDDYFVASLEVSGRARPVSSGGRTLLGD